MPDLRFGVLGPLEVRVDGGLREVPPGRRRAVLACLLVHAGRPVSPDALVEAGWGSGLPQDPYAALHTVLSRLRSVLGPGAIASTAAGYRLVDPSVDAAEFEELVAAARAAASSVARALLEQALALWRGPAYGDLADAPFALAEAARLEGLRKDATEAYAELSIELGDPAGAVVALEEVLAGDPFREHAVELVVRGLYLAGRQAEALERFRAYRTLLAEELGLDPSPALVRLHDRVLGHDLAAPEPRVATGLPSWLDTSTAFIGREDDLEAVVASVAAERVTVLTGPGGVGKSRLAAESLGPLSTRLGMPPAVVELAAVAPARVVAAVADAVGLRADAEDELVEYLGAVPHLLVLDNCEHLLDEVTPLVGRIARHCPEVRILATSRRRLGVASERVVPLAPLRLPDPSSTPGAQQAVAAVRLLTDRVRRLRPSFAVTADNAPAVAELCRRLDGLPLALELAASRAAVGGVDEVLAGLDDGRLRAGADGLDAVVEWSYRLLPERQRLLLQLLSVFTGEVTADAVRGLTAYVPSWQGDPGPDLAELAESSLVATRVAGGTVRHRLLATVHAFAADRLVDSGLEGAARLAHARWVRDHTRDLAASWATDTADAADQLSRGSGEIVTALRWALDHDHVPVAADITDAVARCLHWTPGLELSDLLIATADAGAQHPDPVVAAGVAGGAFFVAERGRLDQARTLARAALEMTDADLPIAHLTLEVAAMYSGDHAESERWLRRLASHPGLEGEAHSSLALLACYGDDLESAREHAAIALAASPTSGAASVAFARYAAGEVEARTDPDRGAELFAGAAAEAERVGAGQVDRVARVALLAVLVRTGRHEAAADLGRSLLVDLRRGAAWPQLWTTLRILAEQLAVTGRPADAAFLLGAAMAAPTAPPLVGQDVGRYADLEKALATQLGRRVVDRITQVAGSTPRAQVVARAEHLL